MEAKYGLIEITWEGSALQFQYTAIPNVDRTANPWGGM